MGSTFIGAFVLIAVLGSAVAEYGVDVSARVAESSWHCLRSNGFTFGVVRGFQSTGHPDPNAVDTLKDAKRAGVAPSTYMFPCPKCGDAAGQVRAAIDNLKHHDAPFHDFWFDIEGPQYWHTSKSENVRFMKEMLDEAEKHHVRIGIYTSESQWVPIMGDSHIGAKYPLWYAHYDNSPHFSDFTRFGGWDKPHMKQYEGDKTLCGVGIDKNYS